MRIGVDAVHLPALTTSKSCRENVMLHKNLIPKMKKNTEIIEGSGDVKVA